MNLVPITVFDFLASKVRNSITFLSFGNLFNLDFMELLDKMLLGNNINCQHRLIYKLISKLDSHLDMI